MWPVLIIAFMEISISFMDIPQISVKINDSNDQMTENRIISENLRWTNYLTTFKRNYTAKEMKLRRAIFNKNIQLIDAQNSKYARGEATFEMGINQFVDLHQHEMSNFFMRNSKRNSNKFAEKKARNIFKDETYDLPEYVNWIEKDAVTPVKDQRVCGSCYAFGMVGSLEGQYAIKNKKLVAFSEQNIIDCSRNGGCKWGNFPACIKYIQKAGGLDTQEQYPYKGRKGKCEFHNNSLKLSGYGAIKSDSEYNLQRAVAEIGPIKVSLDVTSTEFILYTKGVLSVPYWSKKLMSHAAVAVGYGVEKGHEYWLIKSSWGDWWGDKGYVKLARNKNNMCGIMCDAEFPILD